ncbi:MAG: TetR/AcrR family transcriptional regulator [Bdellovibrionales bacterium]|nr:TetR/AcrR family transcriptional regulator [Bdellovibrionales bacterium]
MKSPTEEIDPLYRKMLPLRITKGEVRKIEIIRAAVECLVEGGYEHFNYNTIGLKAGLARSHIAHYFPDKREILYLVVHGIYRDLQQLVIEKITEASTPEAQIKGVIDATIEGIARERGWALVILLFTHVCAQDENYRKLYTEIRKVGAKRIERILQGMAGFSEMTPRLRYNVARGVQSIILGGVAENLTTDWLSGPGPIKKQIYQQVMAYIESSSESR